MTVFSNTEVVFLAIGLCLLLTAVVGALLRRGPWSLGLPFAYSALLMLEHIPGAWAAAVSGQSYARLAVVETGINLTTVGLFAFVIGAFVARRSLPVASSLAGANQREFAGLLDLIPPRFLWFCLGGGWLLTFAAHLLINVPSVNAVIEKGSAIWLLAVMIGLTRAISRRSAQTAFWGLAMLVYPTFVLVIGGFMSWGSASIVIVMSTFCVLLKHYWLFLINCALAALVGMSLFVSYFEIRNDLREAAWGGAPIAQRAAQASRIFDDLGIVSSDNTTALKAFDKRLNQNYFIGVAAQRLDRGQVNYLWGRSVWEGVIALIPRVIWPDKPVFGGSGDIVRDMTGLALERHNTAWGVGSVMEFYVNFGTIGLIAGFLLFGFLLARLDSGAARNLAERNYGRAIIYFLPGVALIQPLGSLVELTSGAAAAVLAGLAWRWAWARVTWTKTLPANWTTSASRRYKSDRLAVAFAPSPPPFRQPDA